MIIDIDMHWHPEEVFSDKSLLNAYIRVTRASGQFCELTTVPGSNVKQLVLSQPKGYENINMRDVFIGVEDRLRAMDEANVDKALIRICCFQQWMTLDLMKRVNDLMAEYCNKYPGRFFGLAAAPPWGDDESLYELERCIKDLGFVGVLCGSHYGTRYLDEEEFRPYFRYLNELGVPICVHHTPLPVDHNSIIKYSNPRRLYGRCLEQMTGLTRILFSDLLDECPNLILIPTMMSGGFFAYTKLLVPTDSGVKEDVNRFDDVSDKIKRYLKNNIYHNISSPTAWSKTHLECAVKELGADHILFGTSYPVKRDWLTKGVDCVNSLDISDKEKALILGENAMRLFNIKE